MRASSGSGIVRLVAGLVVAACAMPVAGHVAFGAQPLAAPDLPAANTWIVTGGGQIRILDKQKAEGRLIDLKLGQSVTFESLSITLRACEVRPPSLPADAAGFLEIDDNRPSEPGFHGWMLSDEPSVAMLESPVYGVRVVGCEQPSAAAIAAAMPVRTKPATAQPDAPDASPTQDTGAASSVPATGDLGKPSPGRPLDPSQN